MNILLTGDDGYNSIGTRVLIELLKKEHSLTIVATKTQQSAVGGKLSLRGGTWGETEIDGVQTFCVDGTPADCAEFAHAYLKTKFDCVLSGVNLGENVSTAIVSSGTVSAAHRCLAIRVAPRAIALSWETPPDYYLRDHSEKDNVTEYFDHPGKMVRETLTTIFDNDFYKVQFLNVNFPKVYTNVKAFTVLEDDIGTCYPPISVDDQTNTFSYPIIDGGNGSKRKNTDIAVLRSGRISITPLQLNWTDQKMYDRLKVKNTKE